MVTLFNDTLDIGMILNATTQNVTGSLTMTLLLVILLLVMIGLLFRSPMILLGLLMLPLIIIFAIYEGWGGLFYTILTVLAIILAWQFAKIIIGWGR
jgi:Sec-independent protein secretion pathway component TatC